MFESTEHRPQLLRPESYSSPEQLESEIDRLFRPAWHCVATKADLPRDGQFRTIDLLGVPIIIWRQGGEFHTFLNVCSHRHCMLTDRPCGTLDKLKCQYHGWEYDETGNTQKIPDAKSFRPMQRGMLGLTKFRTETCGQLIFVTMSDDAPSLREWLGWGHEMLADWFSDDRYMTLSDVIEVEANWKIVMENSVESYHSTEVHPKTFGVYPREELCRHDLFDNGTRMTVDYSEDPQFRGNRLSDALAHFWVGIKPEYVYQHAILYPGLLVARMSLFTTFWTIIPISPTRSRWLFTGFCRAGRRRSLYSRWRSIWLALWHRHFVRTFMREDERIFAPAQSGLASPLKPKGGLISTREERVFHFQQYVAEETGCGTLIAEEPALVLSGA